jgi:hypothetical protein
VLLAAAAATMLVTGSFGFTSVSAERGVSVNVVEDNQAYIDYHAKDLSVENGDRVELVTLQNQLGGEVELVDYSIDNGPLSIENVSGLDTVSPGSNGTISGTVHCTQETTGTVGVTVKLSGSGVSAEISGETREFDIRCEEPSSDAPAQTLEEGDVSFTGSSKVSIDDALGTIEIDYWTKKGNGKNAQFKKHEAVEFDSTNDLVSKGDGKIVAVYFPEYEVAFLHPGHCDGNGNSGTGDGRRVPGEHGGEGPPGCDG